MAVRCKKTCGLCGGNLLPIYDCAIFRVAETIVVGVYFRLNSLFNVICLSSDHQETVDISYTGYFFKKNYHDLKPEQE